jgi:hypothetical protein
MPEKDNLDVRLDSALATYADPGPESGLEDRVLVGLQAARSSGERRRLFDWPRLTWAVALPVAVCLLWVSLAKVVHAPSTQSQAPSQPEPSQSAQAPAQPPAVKMRPSRARALSHSGSTSAPLKSCPVTKAACDVSADVAKAVPVPKLDVFPAPQPLTGEERVLVAAATNRSPAEREALAASQKQADAPLSIADLNIPPLAPPDEGKN